MSSIATPEADSTHQRPPLTCRLFVAWQRESSREYVPVGRLTYRRNGGGAYYEFAYIRNVEANPDFPGISGFPDYQTVYQSEELFPFFENRILSRGRTDRAAFTRSLDLPEEAEPMEILARTEGRRATDTFELFPEPTVTVDGIVRTCFFVRGVRHIEGAHDAIDRLSIGQRLSVQPEPENVKDPHAVLVLGEQRIGYLPRYLTELVHHSYASNPDAIVVNVNYIGDRSGPAHFRILCSIEAPWPPDQFVFAGLGFESVTD